MIATEEALDFLEERFAYELRVWLDREIANADADHRQSPTGGPSAYFYRGRAQALANTKTFIEAYLGNRRARLGDR